MKVIYRMCDIPSTNPSPIYQDDKPKLNKFCLKSFLKAFEGVELDITFLCDFCGPETIAMIRALCPDSEIIETKIGINETMRKSYELAKESNSDTILFAECDYYWLKPITEHQIQSLYLISPYDHPDFYTRPDIHGPDCYISLIGNEHFKTSTRNTMTFGMTKQCLIDNYESLMYWGYLDNEVWSAMRKLGYPLWTPIPTFATHMVTDYLSPGIDLYELWKTQT